MPFMTKSIEYKLTFLDARHIVESIHLSVQTPPHSHLHFVY